MNKSISCNDEPPTKRKRQGRRSNDQMEYMVDYLIQHPNLSSGKFLTMNSKNALQGSWEELVRQLNDMRTTGQSEKNVKSWKESWRDQKTKTSKKVGALRSARVQTGNRKTDIPQLSDLDKKVLSIIGNDYVEGTSCPDSWPEEQENNVQRLATGDQSIYLIEPSPITLQMHEEKNQGNELDPILDNIEYETFSCSMLDIDNSTFGVSKPTSEHSHKTIDQSIDIDNSITFSVSKPTNKHIHKSTDQSDETLSGSTSSKIPKIVKQKLSNQLQTARNSFSLIAEKQADSNKLMADSLSTIGKALEKIADNDAKRIENEKKLLDLYEKILEKI